MRPYLERLFQAFGPRRLLWAADQTTLRGSYADCLHLFTEELDFLSSEAKTGFWINPRPGCCAGLRGELLKCL